MSVKLPPMDDEWTTTPRAPMAVTFPLMLADEMPGPVGGVGGVGVLLPPHAEFGEQPRIRTAPFPTFTLPPTYSWAATVGAVVGSPGAPLSSSAPGFTVRFPLTTTFPTDMCTRR